MVVRTIVIIKTQKKKTTLLVILLMFRYIQFSAYSANKSCCASSLSAIDLTIDLSLRLYAKNTLFNTSGEVAPVLHNLLASYLTSSDLVAMRNNCILFQDSENYNLNISYDYNEDGYPRQAIINEEGYGSSNITLGYVSVNNN